MTKKFRAIVNDAYKCEALVYQFETIDADDNYLGITRHSDLTIKEQVNKVYSDRGIILEALNRYEIGLCNPDDRDYRKENRQLKKFLNKYNDVNDNRIVFPLENTQLKKFLNKYHLVALIKEKLND